MRTDPIYTALVASVCLAIAATAQDDFASWLAKDRAEQDAYNEAVTRQYEDWLESERKAFDEFLRQAGAKWGHGNVWIPEQKVWVQYNDSFEKRTAVDFERGQVRVQLLFPKGAKALDPATRNALVAEVKNLLLSGTEDPVQMVRRQQKRNEEDYSTIVSRQGGDAFVHTVQPGETLWGIGKRFNVSRDKLAKLNNISPDAKLKVGQKLVLHAQANVPTATAEPPKAASSSKHTPLLAGQVQTPDGRLTVTAANAGEVAATLVAAATPVSAEVTGSEKQVRTAIAVEFPLAKNHVQVRAERYRSYVTDQARRYGVDPALIMAVIHTESCFNPRARSGAPAFGLMQLVPSSGARDAYQFVHKEDRLLDAAYLYDPAQNIELGAAFLHILDGRYLKAIADPASRTYCAIAAYNTGAGNVARAFGAGTSVVRAAPIINRMKPDSVYATLRRDLPHQETRDYVQRVSDRIPLYASYR
jgi:soluble lytic murein transglycosylase-like protein